MSPGSIPCARAGTYPLRAGNLVRPLIDGEPAFRRIAEAVEAARAHVWVTVAFIERDLALPDGHGTFFDLIERAAERGLDVRVLFWREAELATILPGSSHFAGTDDERAWLRERGARFLARWDHLPRWCHHQKSWLIDAGTPGEVAFVGGINLDTGSIVAPGHLPLRDGWNVHDVYAELCGPVATDVHHNFVQRWNEASERTTPDGAWPDAEAAGALPFPATLSPAAGDVPVQLSRTVSPGRYACATPAPGGTDFAIARGEASACEQYLAAIDAATRTIYLENQFFAASEVFARLDAALARGVEVVVAVPGNPMDEVRAARRDPRSAVLFEQLAALARHDAFTLVGPTACAAPGAYQDVYVHAKIALVDDVWATIGSTNVLGRSFHRDTELNASFWHPATVRALRRALLQEHLAADTDDMDDRSALRLYRNVAYANGARRAAGERLVGLACALDARTYAA